MKALVKERPEPGLSLLDIPMPEIISPDDVLFKVEYCAICVGEVKVYDWNVVGFFGGTSLLILVGVALDTVRQIEQHLLMRHYDGFGGPGSKRLRGRRS